MEARMDFLVNIAQGFINLFVEGGKTFVGLLSGIIPTLVVLLTFVNTLVALIGKEKVDNFAKKAGGPGIINFFLRHVVLAFLANFVFTVPMCFTAGRFLPENRKASWWDSCCTLIHPMIGFFPHVIPGELFVYLGIANGVAQLGYSLGELALRYLLLGLLFAVIHGIVTQFIVDNMYARKKKDDAKANVKTKVAA
jgi:glucitol/sorbitol PTS system EIIC component